MPDSPPPPRLRVSEASCSRVYRPRNGTGSARAGEREGVRERGAMRQKKETRTTDRMAHREMSSTRLATPLSHEPQKALGSKQEEAPIYRSPFLRELSKTLGPGRHHPTLTCRELWLWKPVGGVGILSFRFNFEATPLPLRKSPSLGGADLRDGPSLAGPESGGGTAQALIECTSLTRTSADAFRRKFWSFDWEHVVKAWFVR